MFPIPILDFYSFQLSFATVDKDKDAIHNSNKDKSVEEVEEVKTKGNNKSERQTFESNKGVVAINEDGLEKKMDEQGNERTLLSTYDGEKPYVKAMKMAKILMKVQQRY